MSGSIKSTEKTTMSVPYHYFRDIGYKFSRVLEPRNKLEYVNYTLEIPEFI